MTFLPFRFFATPSVGFTSVCFSSVCFPRTLCFAFLFLYHSSHPPRFLALLVIRFHRCFRDPLFALLSVGPSLLFSYFSFISLLFPPISFVVWLSSFSFPLSLFFHSCLSLHGSFVVAPSLSSHFPNINLPNVWRYISAFVPLRLCLSLLSFSFSFCSLRHFDRFLRLTLSLHLGFWVVL